MSLPVVLLIDLLGVKTRWHHGGRAAAQRAFKTLEAIVIGAHERETKYRPIGGIIETDSAVLVFDSLISAIPFARRVYFETFIAPKTHLDSRLWLRGVIVPYRGTLRFRYRARSTKLPPTIQVNRLEESVLDAIAAEKSGFRGMRLLVGGGTGTGRAMRGQTGKAIFKEKKYRLFHKLRTPPYPKRLRRRRFRDFFWMASADPSELALLDEAMARRLRRAAGDPEEFLQAAATQVVFHHWKVLMHTFEKVHVMANPLMQPTGRERPEAD